MLIDFRKKSTPIKFVFNFDNLPIQSIDNFLIIGVIFESSFNITSFINSKILKSNFQLFHSREIWKSLAFLARKTIVISLVLSVIDCCNILLSGLPVYKIKPLESILRSAIIVVYYIPYC